MPPEKKATDSKMPPPPGKNLPSGRNITDTDGWKTGKTGAKRIWANYKKSLRDHFNNMTRAEQEDLIDKFSMIITIGVTVVVVLIANPFIPRLIRVLGVPLALMASWWAGRRIVAPVMIDRLEHLLKKDEREEREDREEAEYKEERRDER